MPFLRGATSGFWTRTAHLAKRLRGVSNHLPTIPQVNAYQSSLGEVINLISITVVAAPDLAPATPYDDRTN